MINNRPAITRERALDAALRRMPGIIFNAHAIGTHFRDWPHFGEWLEAYHAPAIRAEFHRLMAGAA